MDLPIGDSASDFENIVTRRLQIEEGRRAMSYMSNAIVGIKPDGKELKVDWELIDEFDPTQRAIIICRYKEQTGSTEEKLPFDVIKLLYLMKSDARYKRGWIILGGSGWTPTLMKFFKNNLQDWIPSIQDRISIIISTEELGRISFSDF